MYTHSDLVYIIDVNGKVLETLRSKHFSGLRLIGAFPDQFLRNRDLKIALQYIVEAIKYGVQNTITIKTWSLSGIRIKEKRNFTFKRWGNGRAVVFSSLLAKETAESKKKWQLVKTI